MKGKYKKPVCLKCQQSYRILKNGANLIVMADFGPYHWYATDLWACPGCGNIIHTGYSGGISKDEEVFEAHLANLAERFQNNDNVLVFFEWESTEQRVQHDGKTFAGELSYYHVQDKSKERLNAHIAQWESWYNGG